MRAALGLLARDRTLAGKSATVIILRHPPWRITAGGNSCPLARFSSWSPQNERQYTPIHTYQQRVLVSRMNSLPSPQRGHPYLLPRDSRKTGDLTGKGDRQRGHPLFSQAKGTPALLTNPLSTCANQGSAPCPLPCTELLGTELLGTELLVFQRSPPCPPTRKRPHIMNGK